MKLRCRCGELVEVDLAETAATVTCSSCGQVYQLQRRPDGKLGARPVEQAAAEPEEPESSLEDLPDEFELEPPGDAQAPARQPDGAQADDVDEWPDEFELETPGGVEEDRTPPPAAGASEGLDEGMEFELEGPTGGGPAQQAPSEAEQAAPRPGGAPPTPVIERAEGGPRPWQESFLGGFVYAYAAVFAGDGWRAWLKFAGIAIGITLAVLGTAWLGSVLLGMGFLTRSLIAMVFFFYVWMATDVKFLVPCIILVLLPTFMFGAGAVAFFTVCAAVTGAMYQYLTHAASSGSEPLQKVQPRFGDDMLVPFVLILGASIVLVLVPVIIGGVVSHFTGGLSLSELQQAAGPEGPSAAQVGGALAQSFILIGTALFGFFCFPMVVMLLVASDEILASLNPVAVFATIARAPLEYIVVWLFILINAFVAVVGIIALSVFTGIVSAFSGILGMLVGTPFIILFLTFLSAAVGWRAGLFMNRNEEAFEHVAQ
ncbi:MAG: DUF4013 domain-containing protein [Candidatus Brocadiia bacterium]